MDDGCTRDASFLRLSGRMRGTGRTSRMLQEVVTRGYSLPGGKFTTLFVVFANQEAADAAHAEFKAKHAAAVEDLMGHIDFQFVSVERWAKLDTLKPIPASQIFVDHSVWS